MSRQLLRGYNINCWGGRYKDNDGTINTNFLCSVGKHSPVAECLIKNKNNTNNLCISCPSGKYNDLVGSGECNMCPVGKYQKESEHSYCYNITDVCLDFDYGLTIGLLNDSCIKCSKINHEKIENECVKCKNRYYLNNSTKTCEKIPLYDEEIFWTLIFIIFCIMVCYDKSEKNRNRNRNTNSIFIIPLYLTSMTSLILYSLYIIDDYTVFKITFGITMMIYLFIMFISYLNKCCNQNI